MKKITNYFLTSFLAFFVLMNISAENQNSTQPNKRILPTNGEPCNISGNKQKHQNKNKRKNKKKNKKKCLQKEENRKINQHLKRPKFKTIPDKKERNQKKIEFRQKRKSFMKNIRQGCKSLAKGQARCNCIKKKVNALK